MSEWDEKNESCWNLDQLQLIQTNDQLNPIPLIKRFAFFDNGKNFLFIGFKPEGNKGICLNVVHIDPFFSGYSDNYDQFKKSKRFFNSLQNVWFQKNDVTDFFVLDLGEDEVDLYFKQTYLLANDIEPVSTRTQDGSYACNSKSVMNFFVHNETNISLFRVLGEKWYPFDLV